MNLENIWLKDTLKYITTFLLMEKFKDKTLSGKNWKLEHIGTPGSLRSPCRHYWWMYCEDQRDNRGYLKN